VIASEMLVLLLFSNELLTYPSSVHTQVNLPLMHMDVHSTEATLLTLPVVESRITTRKRES
jgi:hypothetical protein